MKTIRSLWLATAVTFAAVIPQSQAQLGGLTKSLTGTVTAASLNGDLTGGLDFFAKANDHFLTALVPAEKAQAIREKLKSEDQKDRSQAVKDSTALIKESAEAQLAEKKPLDDKAKAEIALGQKEIAKGITKWAAVGVSLGMAAQKGGGDAALVAAIPVATEMIKDLPALTAMNAIIKKLNAANK